MNNGKAKALRYSFYFPSPRRLCRNPFLSLRATEGSVAIYMLSMPCEIASVVSLLLSDIATPSLVERIEEGE